MSTNFLVYEKQEAKNIPKYSIKVQCYYGDADGWSTFTLKTNNERQMLAHLIELHIAMLLFPNGRGGCRDMYDYAHYFCGDNTAQQLCANHKAFQWTGSIPYDHDGQQAQTIESYSVRFSEPDFQGIVDLDTCIIKQIATVMEVINDVHIIGDYVEWDMTHKQIGKKSAEGWLPDVLKLRDDLLKEYDETMKEG